MVPSAPPLNILFIFSDQETAAANRPPASTPSQDALARRAISFRTALCTAPQCSPSRSSLLTGLFPHQTGVEINVEALHGRDLPSALPTLGTRLGQAGYATGYFGKWHLSTKGPAAHGFTAVWRADQRGAADPEIARHAADWITARRDERWCAVVSFINPHDITSVRPHHQQTVRAGIGLPTSLADDLVTKPDPQRQFLERDSGQPYANATAEDWLRYRSAYAGYLEALDACLGRVLHAVDASGQWERTLVVYTSDHGDLVGAHGLPYKGPFLYDELVHVPLVISWPGYEPSVRQETVSLIHLVPTMLDAAGQWPQADLPGCSLRSLLAGERRTWSNRAVFEYLGKQSWLNPLRGLRAGRWQYTRYLWGGEELYDLRSDPREMRNLAGDPTHAPSLLHLRCELQRWREGAGDAGRWEVAGRSAPLPP